MKRLLTNRSKALALGIMALVNVALYESTPAIPQFYDIIPSTKDLNPTQVQLVVNTHPEFLKRLSSLADLPPENYTIG